MKNFFRILGLMAFISLLPAANAADASGTWKGAFDFQGTNVPLTFHFTIANGAVTGSVDGLPTTPAEPAITDRSQCRIPLGAAVVPDE